MKQAFTILVSLLPKTGWRSLGKRLLADILMWMLFAIYLSWLSEMTFKKTLDLQAPFILSFATLGILFFWIHTFTVIPLIRQKRYVDAADQFLFLLLLLLALRLTGWFVLTDHYQVFQKVLRMSKGSPDEEWLLGYEGQSWWTWMVSGYMAILYIGFFTCVGALIMFPTSLAYGNWVHVKGWPSWIRRLTTRLGSPSSNVLEARPVRIIAWLSRRLSKITLSFASRFSRLHVFSRQAPYVPDILAWLILFAYTFYVYSSWTEETKHPSARVFLVTYLISGVLFFWYHTFANVPAVRQKNYLEAFSRAAYLTAFLLFIRMGLWAIFIPHTTFVAFFAELSQTSNDSTEAQRDMLKVILKSENNIFIFSVAVGGAFIILIGLVEVLVLLSASVGYGVWKGIQGWPVRLSRRWNPFTKPVFWAALGWIGWAYLHFIQTVYTRLPSWENFLYYLFILIIPTATVFYFNIHTSFRLLDRKKYLLAIFWTFVLLIMLVSVKVLLFRLAHERFGMSGLLCRGIFETAASLPEGAIGKPVTIFVSVDFQRLNRIFLREDFFLMMLSFVLGFSRRAEKYRRDSVRLAEEKQQEVVRQKELENALLKQALELSENRRKMLQYQINPHFLFNTLNVLYARALLVSPPLADAFMKLSEAMRYSLREAAEGSKSLLEDEIRHLTNYIELNQYRFSGELQVRFEADEDRYRHRISPLVLITFVENAFKHGDLHDPAHPVHIRLNLSDSSLVFWVRNKKRVGQVAESTGIGLKNTRERLQMAYPNQHSLQVMDEPAFYTVELKIDFWMAPVTPDGTADVHSKLPGL
ncbi:sensor histidine kinase [Spirosoma sp. 209]|uniref:sensor histidine kinase n=1 Tax=Spirosoma sp. 209 TaxID=1955701 RepID=UPI00098D099A|nr:histidine kinase [Spirosoma sp. 209]